MRCFIFLFFYLLILASKGNCQNLMLEITGLKTHEGVIVLTFYTHPESYAKEIPDRTQILEKDNITGGKLRVTLSGLEPGRYAIALIDDTNRNGRLDYRFFVPSEGFAFSNLEFRHFRKPDFDSFCFDLGNDDLAVVLPVHYF
ncbi:MAG TPA: DUF2141 domain-containing protein [Prolixibacteraceae bacterium]|nr:DUF2141 domain-containing protein [Prolixibacteraceae bacterium]